MSDTHTDIMDKPLEPGKIYTKSVVLLKMQIDASRGDLIRWIVEKAVAELLGPRAEHIRLPIGTDAICLTLSARIEPWKL